MSNFIVNGQPVVATAGKKLMRYLRDDLRLTSVKDGCSEGACGTCTVLVEGKPTRACTQAVEKFEGKHILTTEGLTDFEKEVYTYAFGETGAVQCGFCIPGMVLCTKALLDANKEPSRAECAYAIRTNICRCTGYVKILDAMMLCAKLMREGAVPKKDEAWKIGAKVHRVDAESKVLGTGIFADDVYLEGMVYGSAVRSAHPRARVLALHKEEALALNGVLAVFTDEDIPGSNKVGHLISDWDSFIAVGDVTRFVGDAICLVVAETPEILAEAKKRIRVEYEVLEPVRNPQEAMAPNAPRLHENGNLLTHKSVRRGNAPLAIEHAKHVITRRFNTPHNEHAFLEPECSVSFPDGDGVMVWSSDQSVYNVQHEIMHMLGLPAELVKVENLLIGGAFGGKEDVTVQHHAALAAFLLKRPIKVALTRAESLAVHPKRHPMETEMTLGCDENGNILGVVAKVISDTGAYASLGGPVLERACTHAAGPYHYENFQIDGYAYYTNNPPAGAYRGFGVTQTCFAIESLLSEMAEKIGISSWEIRHRNAIRPGEVLPNGQIVGPETGLLETLEALKPYYDKAKHVGIACAMKNTGLGVGVPDYGRARLVVQDGKIHIHTGASCMGQGLTTVIIQMVCEFTGLTPDSLVLGPANTFDCPDSGTSSGSRQTTFTGEACRRACAALMEAKGEKPLSSLNGQEFVGVYFGKTDSLGAEVPNPISHVAYSYATQMCEVGDDGKIAGFVAAHNVGRVVNPKACEGQIEGGIVMSMGFALTEQYQLENCVPKSKFGTLGLFKSTQIPEITSIIVEKSGLELAGGAVGVGEICSIPTVPAIAEAYYRLDGERRTQLPLANTPYAKKK